MDQLKTFVLFARNKKEKFSYRLISQYRPTNNVVSALSTSIYRRKYSTIPDSSFLFVSISVKVRALFIFPFERYLIGEILSYLKKKTIIDRNSFPIRERSTDIRCDNKIIPGTTWYNKGRENSRSVASHQVASMKTGQRTLFHSYFTRTLWSTPTCDLSRPRYRDLPTTFEISSNSFQHNVSLPPPIHPERGQETIETRRSIHPISSHALKERQGWPARFLAEGIRGHWPKV